MPGAPHSSSVLVFLPLLTASPESCSLGRAVSFPCYSRGPGGGGASRYCKSLPPGTEGCQLPCVSEGVACFPAPPPLLRSDFSICFLEALAFAHCWLACFHPGVEREGWRGLEGEEPTSEDKDGNLPSGQDFPGARASLFAHHWTLWAGSHIFRWKGVTPLEETPAEVLGAPGSSPLHSGPHSASSNASKSPSDCICLFMAPAVPAPVKPFQTGPLCSALSLDFRVEVCSTPPFSAGSEKITDVQFAHLFSCCQGKSDAF